MLSEAPRSTVSEAAPRSRDHARFLPLVRRIATKIARRLPSHIGVEDLVGYGWIGLLEAVGRADPALPGRELDAYVACRVRGAILDHLRERDPASRLIRSRSRRTQAAIRALRARLDREPTSEEIAGELRMTVTAYRDMLEELALAGMARLEATAVDPNELPSNDARPDERAAQSALVANVTRLVEGFSPRERTLLALYYQDECTLKEIGAVLGVSAARVCQLHSEIMLRLRASIGEG